MADDRTKLDADYTEPSDSTASVPDGKPPHVEDERLVDLISSIRKIEEYLIVHDPDLSAKENWPFSEGSSSFYVWLKETYRRRSLRVRYFNSGYFSGEPAWDMMLDLAAARIEGKRISVTSACLASGVPPTTALRWISILENDGMIIREVDYSDRRRMFLRISDSAMDLLNSYYDAIHSHPGTKRRAIRKI